MVLEIILAVLGTLIALALAKLVIRVRMVSSPYVIIVRRWGKPHKIIKPGRLGLGIWIMDQFSKPIRIEVTTLNEPVEVRTRDGSYLSFPVNLQYKLIADEFAVWLGSNKLSNPEAAMMEIVKSQLSQQVATKDFEELFRDQEELTGLLLAALNEQLRPYAYIVTSVHLSTPEPDPVVKSALDERTAAKYRLQAAETLARAAQAEAEANGNAVGAMVKKLTAAGIDPDVALRVAQDVLRETVTGKFADGDHGTSVLFR